MFKGEVSFLVLNITFVLGWLNEHFQKEAKDVLQRLKRCFTRQT